MHRSGTSCLTGLLEEAGVFLGEVSKFNPYNRKGNQENLRIMQLHDEVLAANGGTWAEPPAGPCTVTPEQREHFLAILADYHGREPWAFKDPRAILLLDMWVYELPELAFIGTFRHPAAVASSLAARGGIDFQRGLALWVHYNRLLIQYQDWYGFDLLCFDMPPKAYLDAVGRAFQRLGLEVPLGGFRFFDQGLRNQQGTYDAIPSDVENLYGSLLERSL